MVLVPLNTNSNLKMRYQTSLVRYFVWPNGKKMERECRGNSYSREYNCPSEKHLAFTDLPKPEIWVHWHIWNWNSTFENYKLKKDVVEKIFAFKKIKKKCKMWY